MQVCLGMNEHGPVFTGLIVGGEGNSTPEPSMNQSPHLLGLRCVEGVLSHL